MRALVLLTLVGCTGKPSDDSSPPPQDSEPNDSVDSVPIDSVDSVPPEDSVDSVDSQPVVIDNDADGSPVEEDCNDADPAIYPGATDVPCDQVDANCDGVGEADIVLIGETRYASVSEALTAATDGDTIDVCPGIHVENLEIATAITLTINGYSGSYVDTELDGGSVGPVLALGEGVDLTLSNIGIVNGLATWRNETDVQTGGGIYANGAWVRLSNVQFYENTAQDYGAGIAVRLDDSGNTGLSVDGCVFHDNHASDSGGAIAVLGSDNADVTVSASTFTDNRAPTYGGAIYVGGDGLEATIDGSDFTTNSTSSNRSYGGAIGTADADVELTVTDSTFSGNTAGRNGAALGLTSSRAVLTADGCTFSANNAYQSGAGMYLESDDFSAEINNSSFASNVSSTDAGGVEIVGGGSAWFDTVSFTDNAAGNAGGGAVFDEGDGLTLTVELRDSTFTTNRCGIGGGGGIYASGARVECENCDMGSGTDSNDPDDVYGCSDDFGSGANFIFDESTGTYCL